MATVYVVFAEADQRFVEGVLLRPLPVSGFDFWVSSRSAAPPEAVELCDAILVVVSRAAAEAPEVRQQALGAMASGRPLAVVRLDETPPAELAPGLEMRLAVVAPAGEIAQQREELRRTLPGVLPVTRPAEIPAALASVAQPLEWNEELFSAALKEAVNRYDAGATSILIEAFTRHISHRPYPYAAQHARVDLATLRKKRQFKSMLAYARAVIASGTDDLRVRRQYGQALIEEGLFEEAFAVLTGVAHEKDRSRDEAFEARGLIGRLYKQQYVDAPETARRPDVLERAIDAYGSVYEEDRECVWHGVNAASLIVRGCDDGIDPARRPRARALAGSILKTLAEREKKKPLEVWDCATRVEALLALEQAGDASAALDRYLQHPGMDAFEVSSTYRQFDQVLRLGEKPERPLLDRLRHAVERIRGLGMSRLLKEPPLKKAFGERGAVPILIRVSDPDWRPQDAQEVTVQGRLGAIVSAVASPEAIAALLRDPGVISIEESRPIENFECDVSVPFIQVTDPYQFAGESFSERGKHALIAIIDDDIDVLHEAFLDEHHQSRIVGIWDQRDDTGPAPSGFTLGTFHDQAQVARYVSQKAVPPALSTPSIGHGTHVCSIAAGRGIQGGFAGGVAPEASILVVIPRSSEPIGYSKTHVDALLFIERTAAERRLPVVVNVSQGMNAGAHDGTSKLEAAFDGFLQGGTAAGRVIVKSAGNERGKNGHARLSILSDSGDELRWVRDPKAISPREQLELWWSSANQLEFQLVSPTVVESGWVGASHPEETGDLNGDGHFRLKFDQSHPDNGDSQLLVELDGTIAPGPWLLRIRSYVVLDDGTIDAWIERSSSWPSSFTNHINEEMTLSIPGTAKNVITVAAVELSEAKEATPAGPVKPRRISPGTFSSYGPTRDKRNKPDVAAPGVGIKAAARETSRGAVPMNGTSMAAPHVAGAIALVLSRAASSGRRIPTSNQIAKALQQRTINGNLRWTPAQGYGVVNVAALLATKF
jgi:subtilisin family serine protease